LPESIATLNNLRPEAACALNIFLSSCIAPTSASVYCAELGRLATLCRSEKLKMVSTPETADLILVVDIFEADLYAGLRHNRVWQQWPEKSFVYYEGDSPPNFLHGLHSSARKTLSAAGRFQACAYPVHQLCYPNPGPAAEELAAMPKDLLCSFTGRASHRVRRQLLRQNFDRGDVRVEDTSEYYHFRADPENRADAHRRYWQLAARSKYALCPRGAGTSSMRIFEMMEAGIAPVIIADDWLPPLGPSWEEFALIVPETEINLIYDKVKCHESEYVDRGRLARLAWEQHFSPEKYWSFILASIRSIQQNQKYSESIYTRSLPLLVLQEWTRQRRIRASIQVKSGLKKLLFAEHSFGALSL
jgi:hypothetical protein